MLRGTLQQMNMEYILPAKQWRRLVTNMKNLELEKQNIRAMAISGLASPFLEINLGKFYKPGTHKVIISLVKIKDDNILYHIY